LISGLFLVLSVIPLSSRDDIAYAQDPGETIVAEMVLCKEVLNMEPVEPISEVSLSDGRIYTWTKIKASSPPTFIKHVYYHEGKKVAEVTLDIKYPTFRTWSYKTLKGRWMIGKWRVEVLSSDDTLLASREFTVSK
jgi:hypothetical protein